MIGYLAARHGQKLIWGMLLLAAAALLCAPAAASEAVASALSLCGNILLPSLFPFFVISSLMIETGLAAALGRYFEFFMRPLFRVPGSCAPAFFLGILCGYPVGAKTAISLYDRGLCDKTEAERLLAFCNNSGPAFILGSVGIGIWNDTRIGILLFVCHALASVTTGILFRFYRGRPERHSTAPPPVQERAPLSSLFVGAVRSSVESMLYLCGFVIFFAIVIRLLLFYRILPALASGLSSLFSFTGLPQDFFEQLLSGIFELTTGVRGAGSGAAPASARLALTGAMLGWAGFSVHCQVLSFLSGSGLSGLPYIAGKLIQSLIAALYTAIACALYPYALPAFHPLLAERGSGALRTFPEMLTVSLRLMLLLLLCTTLLFLLGRIFLRRKRDWKSPR